MIYGLIGFLVLCLLIWWGIGLAKAFCDRAEEGDWEKVAIGAVGVVVFGGCFVYIFMS